MDRKLLRTSIACAMLGLGLTQIAGGQAAPEPAPNEAASKAAPPPVAGKATIGVTVAETQLVATGYRASRLLHQDVYNDKGEKVGKVDDLVISTDGKLSTAIVNVGGFLGVGKHLVAIPVREFAHIAPKAVLPKASKDELKALPKFEYTA
ncbi:PRC-barrel domain-containing protein [Variovorax sp. OV329]|uniref:PRC-barrel domain-containing protein n=1 Tax=Variovorax sp. OV329 TaxID=1882825 RepID=UPI0008F23D31|nr:PRC-barrel domain-containing protein [Variovorax sp. OV329]SFN22347.1 PRC-barrel domain-containing protein [Variovorax sp. OV329]